MKDTHNEVMRAIGRLEGKVDGINTRLDTLNGGQAKQDAKIDALESCNDQAKGKAAIIAGIVGIAVSIFISLVVNYLK